jgi:hypothetical protein
MMMWAMFQPRTASPRKVPRQLYYPSLATHIVEKYWDYLNDPIQHPDCSESDFTKRAMTQYAEFLSRMDLSGFAPEVNVESSEKACRVSSTGAGSRRLRIQDAIDFWEPRRESADSSVIAPGQDSHNVGT